MSQSVPLWSLIVIILIALPFFVNTLYQLYLNTRDNNYSIEFHEIQDGLDSITIVIKDNKLESLYLHMNNGEINQVVQDS